LNKQRPAKGVPGEGSNMFRTMLVEDKLAIRQLVKDILESQFPSMGIIEASDGVEAFQKIGSHPPNLIFMDIGLPGENGLELTRKIKKQYPDIIIIILTTYDSIEYREAAIRNKANGFLAKSSDTLSDIGRLVQSILSEKGFNADGSEPKEVCNRS